MVGGITNSNESRGGKQKSLHQCDNNKGDDHGLLRGQTPPVVRRYRYSGVHQSNDLTWGQQHFQSGQEGTAVPLLPQEAEVCWTWKLSPLLVLQMCGGVLGSWVTCVPRKLLCGREGSSAEGGEGCTDDC